MMEQKVLLGKAKDYSEQPPHNMPQPGVARGGLDLTISMRHPGAMAGT